MAMADREAALLVEEKDFSSGALSRAVISLLDDETKRRRLCENITSFAMPDANQRIYELIVEAVDQHRKKQK